MGINKIIRGKVNFIHRDECPSCESRASCLIADQPNSSDLLSEVLGLYKLSKSEMFDLKRTRYRLNCCIECDTVYQPTVLDDESTVLLYDVWIDPARSLSLFLDYKMEKAKQNFSVLEVCCHYTGKPLSRTTVGDFGAGWGAFSKIAYGLGCEVTAIELSSSRRDHLASFGIRVAEIKNIEPCSLDILNMDQVLEHLPQPRECLQEARRILVEGGILYVGIPYDKDLLRKLHQENWKENKFYFKSSHNRYKETLNAVAPLEHINAFSEAGLSKIMNDYGFLRMTHATVKYKLGLKVNALFTKELIAVIEREPGRFWLKQP